ncbi:MAG: hypothetical protein KAR79_03010 [Simkaniaceae bacterium]|nr:hypothetical protein [Simkaniaceae bacterium]
MFEIIFTEESLQIFSQLKATASQVASKGKSKTSPQQGLFKQVKKTIKLLSQNPRHPGLHTHEHTGFEHPWDSKHKVFEAYVQNRTSGAYRLFWCYGPSKNQITVITIIQHP